MSYLFCVQVNEPNSRKVVYKVKYVALVDAYLPAALGQLPYELAFQVVWVLCSKIQK